MDSEIIIYRELMKQALNSDKDMEMVGIYLLVINYAKKNNISLSFKDVEEKANFIIEDETYIKFINKYFEN